MVMAVHDLVFKFESHRGLKLLLRSEKYLVDLIALD